eukprot:2516258-Amphidinium_carterae.1
MRPQQSLKQWSRVKKLLRHHRRGKSVLPGRLNASRSPCLGQGRLLGGQWATTLDKAYREHLYALIAGNALAQGHRGGGLVWTSS